MANGKWKETEIDEKYKGHLCPSCSGRTETLVRIDTDDGFEYNSAERCTACRWIVDFEADEIKAKHY